MTRGWSTRWTRPLSGRLSTRSAHSRRFGITGASTTKAPDGIVLKGDEKALGEALGLLDIGYKGYAGFELCHPLPVVNGKTVGVDFVDKNAQLAREYMQGIIAEAKKQHAAKA